MKIFNLILILICSVSVFTGCNEDVLDTYKKTGLDKEEIVVDAARLQNLGYAAYGTISTGYGAIDGSLFAAVTDEAQQTSQFSDATYFNEGIWSAYSNPVDQYAQCYRNIRSAYIFLEESADYKNSIIKDTISSGGKTQYAIDTTSIGLLRSEARVLIAYNYFELIKRYGAVPLVKQSLNLNDNLDLPQTDFNGIVDFIVGEVDAVKNKLLVDFSTFDTALQGRVTRGTALALKARTLLYAASPLHNPSNDVSKWQKAAAAAYEVIQMNKYSLHNNYQNLFIADNTAKSAETIWAYRLGQINWPEKANYPITIRGGNSGVCPTHDLVEAYELKTTANPNDLYANRDPRLKASIVLNNTTWNGRLMEFWPGGKDDMSTKNATRTGYYLKKFMNDNLNLFLNTTILHSWVIFRYGEVLLNYAEAMNEAYGPDNNNGYSLTAREAVNLIRKRPGVEMPDVVASDKTEMRGKIKHERRIELAFEDHRYWDLLRWKEAETVLNQPVHGVTVAKNDDGLFFYTKRIVANRVFDAPKMYYFPIPQDEINKSNGVLKQNPGW